MPVSLFFPLLLEHKVALGILWTHLLLLGLNVESYGTGTQVRYVSLYC